MKKVCGSCGKRKSVESFAWKSKSKGKRGSSCKSCHADYSRKHYGENRQAYLDKAKKRSVRVRSEIRELIWGILSENPCKDCGESDPVVLDFDHRGDKKFCIAEAERLMPSSDRLNKEIAKCDVRCANCHRRKTAKQRGWWKYKAGVVERQTRLP